MNGLNNFVLSVATVNGSGSQSANQVLVRSLFRMGLPVGAKNLFPSNIAGLPTWFTIRVSKDGYVARQVANDILVALTPATLQKDLVSLKPGGIFMYPKETKEPPHRADVKMLPIPFRELSSKATDSVKMRKLLVNMIYVGVLAECLDIPDNILSGVIQDQFKSKASVVEANMKAITVGREYAREAAIKEFVPYRVQSVPKGNDGKILMDGNSASALGLMYGGCSFMAWYPITPSSSVAESFQKYSGESRVDFEMKNRFAIVQAEDELSAINMVIGAGWAGARAVTPTSGPGLSLMAEGAGLAYFAEIPAVIWDVQRAGPSTGLPTRTLQGDLRSARNLSHGDAEHILLLPGTLSECFEFGQTALDLAEQFQTLVIVLSDLDLGMNLSIDKEFQVSNRPLQRGKVLNAEQLMEKSAQGREFGRYRDVDGDAVPYRTLPATPHAQAAYFTRGTAHTETSAYSEDHDNFRELLMRLKRKFENLRTHLPKPIVDKNPKAQIGLIAFGSSEAAIAETRSLLKTETSYMRIRSLPFQDEVRDYIAAHDRVVVIEQNRDGQLAGLLRSDFPALAHKITSVTHFDGLPLAAEIVVAKMEAML